MVAANNQERLLIKNYFPDYNVQQRSRVFKNGADKTKKQNFVRTYVKDSFEKNMFPCSLGLNCPKLYADMSACPPFLSKDYLFFSLI